MKTSLRSKQDVFQVHDGGFRKRKGLTLRILTTAACTKTSRCQSVASVAYNYHPLYTCATFRKLV